jgi:hypothetical protein
MATITAGLNEQTGNVTLNVGSVCAVELSPNAAYQIAGRILTVLGRTSLTLNPDGTYTAR